MEQHLYDLNLDDEFAREMDYFREFADQNNLKSVWSIFHEGVRFDEPHNLDATFITYTHYWPNTDLDAVPSVLQTPIRGKTWGDVYKACDELIQSSGDRHHIFVEGFTRKTDTVVDMFTGS